MIWGETRAIGRHTRHSFMMAALVALATATGCNVSFGGGDARGPGADGQEGKRGTAKGADNAVPNITFVDVDTAEAHSEIVWLGEDKRDGFGYPLRSVDQTRLLALLRQRRFADLTRQLEGLQRSFEKDFREEGAVYDAFAAFETADARLGPLLDAWVVESGHSFAPHMASAEYHHARAWHARGEKTARETGEARMQTMHERFEPAIAAARRALALNSRLQVAYRLLHFIATARSEDEREWYDRAVAACSPCVGIREAAMYGLRPRWGGSYARMEKLAESVEAQVAANPRFATLRGYIELDQAQVASQTKDHEGALTLADRALARGEHWEFRMERGRYLALQRRDDEALAEYDRASALHPQSLSLLELRAIVLARRKRWIDAGTDLLTLARLDPSYEGLRARITSAVKGVVHEGVQLEQAGKHDEALGAYELAAALDPGGREGEGRMGMLRASLAAKESAEIARLEQKAKLAPHDYATFRALDDALARERRYAEIRGHWDRYLAANPSDRLARYERSGTLHRLGLEAEAMNDLRVACDLGLVRACLRLPAGARR
jgi:tetratricopeptide (TPR) repeat protein